MISQGHAREALELTALIAQHDPTRGERYAVRWLQRSLEKAPAPTVADVTLLAATLGALGGARTTKPSPCFASSPRPKIARRPVSALMRLRRGSARASVRFATARSPRYRTSATLRGELRTGGVAGSVAERRRSSPRPGRDRGWPRCGSG